MATCEKCGNEPSNPYTFLYGTESATSQTSGNVTETTRRYNVTGEETVSIGGRCIADYRSAKKAFWNIFLAISLPIAAVGLILGIPAGDDSPLKLGIIVGLSAAALSVIGWSFVTAMPRGRATKSARTSGSTCGEARWRPRA